MGFADNYFVRFKSRPEIFSDNPCSNTGIIVVIPCYNEDFIFDTLNSLEAAKTPDCSIEVLVIVNSSENTPDNIIAKNRETFQQLVVASLIDTYTNFNLLPYLIEKTQKKTAGVGIARKTGMDEAVMRFNKIDKANGIICSLDADSLVSADYFTEIFNFYSNNQKSDACIFQFQHNFDTNLYSKDEILACKLYEIYLRYFRLAIEYSGFPNAIHTIGSCFSVKAATYCKAGGMSTRQAGEDFYFLHKIAPMTNIGVINKAIVFPAPRVSDRVPFGTGPAVSKIISEKSYKVYNFALFKILKEFYASFPALQDKNSDIFSILPKTIANFTGADSLLTIVKECRNNTNNLTAFTKRMFSKFDAFFAIRFLNSFDERSEYPPLDVIIAVSQLFDVLSIKHNFTTVDQWYEQIVVADLLASSLDDRF